MAAATFETDLVEIATQVAEAAAGIGSFISGLQNIDLARKYYDLYNQQRQFYYNVFQNGAEKNLATQTYSAPTYVVNYGARAQTVLNPSTGPLGTIATDIAGWAARHAGMFAQVVDPDITELALDKARLTSDWVNYLYRFEELWADIRNDTRWAQRLTVHNVGIKQGTAITAALSDAVRGYSDQITDLSSQLATYGNGIAKYAGYKRGLQDTAQEFTVGTSFSHKSVLQPPDYDTDLTYKQSQSPRVRGMV
jgi:hypothetical protein